jgi:Tetratrico peptide repeat
MNANEATDWEERLAAWASIDDRREREGLAIALAALAPHLPRYQRSLANYARELVDSSPAPVADSTT